MSLLFSDPTGSGITRPGAVLIQGDAIAEDRIFTDISSEPDLAALAQTVFARQPAGSSFMISRLGRRLFPYYCVRLLVHVTPRRAYAWPTRDSSEAAKELAKFTDPASGTFAVAWPPDLPVAEGSATVLCRSHDKSRADSSAASSGGYSPAPNFGARRDRS